MGNRECFQQKWEPVLRFENATNKSAAIALSEVRANG